nr:reverse transcriptase domain-containing protein [Tanacetum cinerariifolium]
RSRTDPILLNNSEIVAEGPDDLPVPDLWTMEELCHPSLNGWGGLISPISIQATNFRLKNDMIQQVQNSCQFHGLPGDDANNHLDKFLHVTQSIKVNGVTDDAHRLYLFPHSLTHHATAWFDRLPRNSINTFEQMAKMFLDRYFPPSMVTKLKNEITSFRQRPDESLFEAWERYKLSIDRCPNHNMLLVTQIDTFYNGLTLRHRDTINAVAGGTFMKRRPKECHDLIENMTAHHNDWDTSSQRSESSSSITSFSDTEIAALKAEMAKINKNLMRVLQVNQQVKAVTLNCETCGGPHSFSDCLATVGNTQNVYAAGAYQDSNLELKNMFGQFMKMNTASSSGSGTLPVVERETEVTKDMMHPTNNGSTEDVQPLVVSTESPVSAQSLSLLLLQRGTVYPGPTIPTTYSSPVVERETETSNTLHNAIMEAGGKDRPPMLAPVDAYPNTCEMWKAIERLKQGESINVQDLETNLYWEFGKFTSRDGESIESYYSRIPQPKTQQAATRNRGKAIVNSPSPIYDQEPYMVDEDDEMSKDKEIDKLMALISLSFKKIYKSTNNNLRTSSNTSRANQDNSPRMSRGTGYDNQRIGSVAGARETVGTMMVQKYKIQCYNCKEFRHVARECQKPKREKDAAYHKEKMLFYQELKAHYMYMAQIQEVNPDVADNFGPIFDSEPLQKVPNNDHYNVFSIESEHPEQSKSVNDTYLIEQDEHNVIIDSLDMSYDRKQIDHDDDDDYLANKQEMVADLRYFHSLELEVDSLKSQLETQKTQFLNKIDRLSREYYYADHMNAILGVYTELDEDLKAQLQDKEIAISELKKLIEKLKRKSVDTKFEKSSVIRQPNAFKSQRSSILGKPTIFSDSLERKDFSKSNLNAKTSNVNFVCVTCGKCVLNDKHDMCVLHSRNDVNSRTKISMAVPVSTREPKRIIDQSVAKPLRRTVASESTNQKTRHTTRKLYEHVKIILFIVDSGCSKHMTGNLKLLTNFVEKFLGMVKFDND